MILLFFILFIKKKGVGGWGRGLFMCYLYYGVLNISDRSWHVTSSVRIFFKKLDSAHKWINCCNKSINVGVFTAGRVHCLFQLFCGLFSFTLHVFISTTVSHHFIMPNQIWNLNELLNAAICSEPSFVVPVDPEVVSFVLM